MYSIEQVTGDQGESLQAFSIFVFVMLDKEVGIFFMQISETLQEVTGTGQDVIYSS